MTVKVESVIRSKYDTLAHEFIVSRNSRNNLVTNPELFMLIPYYFFIGQASNVSQCNGKEWRSRADPITVGITNE